jgi:putative transposase
MEAEILTESVEFAREKKVDCALALVEQGRPVKPVCSALGVARSHVAQLLVRPADWIDGRTSQTFHQPADAILVDDVRAEITALSTYGYRQAGALVNRTRALMSLPAINHKRFYRVMKANSLLLPKAPKRPISSRVHNGVVSMDEPNQRWCSDGFEIACDNGEVVTGVFMKDCCDREIIAWRAWAERGLPGEPVRDMLVEAVEARFGQASVGSTRLEFLSDNGGAYRTHETHALVRALGIKPVHTPVSNGIAESFVNTFKRDYVNFDGPQQRRNRSGSTARRLYALQRGPSAFVAEMEIASHVQEGASAPGSGKRR